MITDGLAEAVRFELTNGFPLPVFKTGAIDHSATLPLILNLQVEILKICMSLESASKESVILSSEDYKTILD